jgi:DNA-binding MarR family transcriptional regulator
MPLNLDDAIRFGFLIQDISRFRRVVIDRVLKPLGVTRSQWWVLTFLSRRDGLTQTALAADLDLTKVAIGALLERMEATGLIERRAEDLDARMRRVYLSREGTRLIKQLRVQIKSFELEALEGITDAELATTFASLRKMKKTLLRMLAEEGAEEPAE